jgi:hypothetical protein
MMWGAKNLIINPKQRNKVAVYGTKFELLGVGYYAPDLPEYTVEVTESGTSFFAVLVDALGCPRAMLRVGQFKLYAGDTFKLRPPPDIEDRADEHEAKATGKKVTKGKGWL